MVTQTDIGRTQSGNGARAWLSPSAAASLRRVDRQLGRTVAVTWGGRSWGEQQALWDKYGPPRAAKPGTSPHESGNAIDTDEWVHPGFVALMAENGWKRTLSWEDWHFVHANYRDTHLNDPVSGGSTTGGSSAQTTEDDMFEEKDRAVLIEALTEIRNTKAGVWTGGTSNGKTFNYGILPIVAHNQTLIGRQSVQINALTAAVSTLAVAKGADPAAILKAVEAGVKEAMRDITFTTDVDG